jgi:uncharacterized membrane protein
MAEAAKIKDHPKMAYLLLKLVHIISSTILFGTGLGSAFYFWRAHRQADLQARYFAVRNVVMADWMFTTPAVIIQPITGFALMHFLYLGLTTHWIMLTLLLYVFTGACWIPVVWLQIQMKKLLEEALSNNGTLPFSYNRYYNYWFYLGWPAFTSVIVIFYLMVFKPALG